METQDPSQNIYVKKGFLYGLLATLIMSIIMLIGVGSGVSPMPAPIPMAISKGLLGSVPKPLLMGFAIISHFGYGSIGGIILYEIVKDRGTFWHGFGWGVLLWLIMELIVLPLLGSDITRKILK